MSYKSCIKMFIVVNSLFAGWTLVKFCIFIIFMCDLSLKVTTLSAILQKLTHTNKITVEVFNIRAIQN